MMDRLKIIAAIGALVFGSVVVFLLATRDAPADTSNPGAITFTDLKRKCTYVVGGTDDGLHIVVTGGEHCRERIIIDGVRVGAWKRVSL